MVPASRAGLAGVGGVSMRYRHEIEGCFAEAIGPTGLARDRFVAVLAETGAAWDRLRAGVPHGAYPFLALASEREDLAALGDLAGRLRHSFDDIVVLATGGSSLGGQALFALAESGPRLHFMDNLDPSGLDSVLGRADLARTAFLAISKSGATAEVLAQCLVALGRVRDVLGEVAIKDRFVVIVEPGDNPLRRLADRWAVARLDHHPRIGGRYSVLSSVGLLPAMIGGLDAAAVRAGAAAVLDDCLGASDVTGVAPAIGAALAVALMRHRGVGLSVLMPYDSRFAAFGRWHRQLWAESLGKGGTGLTPIAALGPVDQHSQLQLYLDGPADKMITMIATDAAGTGPRIDAGLGEDNGLAYLDQRTLGDVVAAAQQATSESLIAHGRPTRVIRVATGDGETMGALFMHFMLETLFAAHLLDVNPVDQPAVEQGKVRARHLLEAATPASGR